MKKYKILKINLIIAFIMSIFCVMMFMVDMIREGSNIYNIIIFFTIMFIGFFLTLNIICLPFYIIKLFLSTKTVINKQYIDSKESIYTRELPEQYNSVIAGEILDLKSKFMEEYVAGVIELISKGYIIEYEDKLVVNNKKETDNLLKNEKYILDTCTKIDKESYFSYSHEFFRTIREDMFDLGLYKEGKFLKNIKDRILYILEKKEKDRKTELIFAIIIIGLPCFIFASFIYNFKLMFFILTLLYITIIVMIRKSKLTKKGEIEKERVGKLKLFFDKETNFKDKTKEERKIWGRYSAFAVALGVNERLKEEILRKILLNNKY